MSVLASYFKNLFRFRYIITADMDMIKSTPVHMDHVGQKRTEKLYQIIIVQFLGRGWCWPASSPSHMRYIQV